MLRLQAGDYMLKNPILIDIPVPIYTKRLLLRPPMFGDGIQINGAIRESFDVLNIWSVWAKKMPTVEDSEEYARRANASWILREDLPLLIFDKNSGQFIGGTGFHNIKWNVPRFEIGYWVRSSCVGQGYVSEATRALSLFAFKQFGAKRIEIRCDADNISSRRVAERSGFCLEAIFQYHDIKNNGERSDTCLYAKYNCEGLENSLLEVKK